VRALLTALLLLATRPAAAHGGSEVLGSSWDPLVVVPLALSWLLYARGTALLWRRTAPGRGVPRWRAACFLGGWLALVLALVSPLQGAGHALFTAHMAEHELLMAVAAPLLVLARPLAPMLRALPRGLRRGIGRLRWPWLLRATGSLLVVPLAATTLHGVALWAWHLPMLFQAALENLSLHRLQHACFLGSALLFWWALLERRPVAPGAAAGHLFVTSIHASLLGALFVFAPRPWYPHQVTGAPGFGLTPLEDQQLGGLLMWLVACSVYVAAALWLLGRWIRGSRPAEEASRVLVAS
jgi:putative membrane protein